jgi:hypothetical protein
MVLYHWGNYFLGSVPYFYDFLRFLTPSFIFITGFIVSMIYTDKYDLADTSVYRRLCTRGAKLLLLFTVLNLIMHGLSLGRRTGAGKGIYGFLSQSYEVYLSGNSALAAFRILVPISYILIISAPWLWASRFIKSYLIVGTLILCCFVQVAETCGWISVNLTLITFGLLGLALGFLGQERICALSAYLGRILSLYLFYLLLISYFGARYWVQVIGVCLSVSLIFALGQKGFALTAVGRHIVTMGRYSLFAYIGQILGLQALRALFYLLPQNSRFSIVALLAAFLLTFLLVFSLVRARKHSKIADTFYKLAFA